MDLSVWYRTLLQVVVCWRVKTEDGLLSSSSLVGEDYSFEGSGFYESLWTPTEALEATDVRYDSVFITSSISSGFATTSTIATFINNLGQSQEIAFSFQLNRDSLITNFDTYVDGVTYYSEIVDITPGDHTCQDLQIERCTNVFLIEVASVAPGSHIVFNLTHREVIERFKGNFKHIVNLSPHLETSVLEISVNINEPQGLRSVMSSCTDIHRQVKLRDDSSFAHVKCTVPHNELNSHLSVKGGDGIFQLQYSLKEHSNSVVKFQGNFFTYHFSPDGLPIIPKHTMFVIDISGSMAGVKLLTVKSALISILKALPVDDKFNIVTLSNKAYKWKKYFVPATKRQISSAARFITLLQVHGGSDVNTALTVAARSFKDDHRVYQSIFFLTDGIPTVGTTNSVRISRRIYDICRDKVAIYSIGLGRKVNDWLLRNLARQNQGRYLQTEGAVGDSSKIQSFFQDYIAPVLSDVRISSDDQAIINGTTTRRKFLAYMEGGEIVVAGMLSDSSKKQSVNFTVSGDGRDRRMKFITQNQLDLTTNRSSAKVRLEHLWAFMKIKDLSHQFRTSRSISDRVNVASKMMSLSHMYEYVTPLTTLNLPLSVSNAKGDFLITRAQFAGTEDSSMQKNLLHNVKWTPTNIKPGELKVSSVARVFGDPHFVIAFPKSNVKICFDIQRKVGDVLTLIKDSSNALQVNGEIIEDSPSVHTPASSRSKLLSLFGRFGIILGSHSILISPDGVLIDFGISLLWSKRNRLTIDTFTLAIHEGKKLTLTQGNSVKIAIQLHTRVEHPSYFDISLETSAGLSAEADGLIGKFQTTKCPMYVQSISKGRDQATLKYLHKTIQVHKKTHPYLQNSSCWHSRAEDFLGDIEQFTTETLFS